MLEIESPSIDSPDEFEAKNLLFLSEHSKELQDMLEQNEPKEEWQVLCDVRDKLKNNQETELQTLVYVDRTIKEIMAKNIEISPYADERMVVWCKKLLTLIQRRRFEQGRRLWTNDQMKIFIYEMVHTRFLSRFRDERKDGSEYWETHLFGSVLNAICDSRITSLASLVALLRHDDFEDLAIHKPKPQPALLMCDQYYYHELEGEQKESVFAGEKRTVHTLVRSLTNLQKMSEADFVPFVQSILDHGIRVAILRDNERAQNLDTVHGHKDPTKIRGVCEQSMRIHAPMASSILKMESVEEHILRACFRAINPGALEHFNRIQTERLKRYFGSDPDASPLLGAISGLANPGTGAEAPSVQYIAVRPLPFTRYLDRSKICEANPFVKIDEKEPMFEILVLTTGGDEAQMVQNMLRTKCDVLFVLSSNSGPVTSWGEASLKDRIPKINPDSGALVQIFNPSVGGRVDVRISTVRREALRPRGVISDIDPSNPDLKETEMPNSMRKSLKAAVRKYRQNPTGFFKHLESIFANPIVVRSRDNEPILLQSGANGIDFAASIHPDVLAAFRAIRVADTVMEPYQFKRPFDTLDNLQMVEVVTDPGVEVPAGYEFNLDLSWRCFAGQGGVDGMKYIYGRLTPDEACETGEAYLEKLSKLFGFESKEQLILTILKLQGKENILVEVSRARYRAAIDYANRLIGDVLHRKNVSEEKEAQMTAIKRDMLISVGSCRTDPIELLADALKLDSPVEIEVVTEHVPGGLDALTGLIKKYGVNIADIANTGKDGKVIIRFSLEIQDRAQYDLMRCILRLGMGNDVRVVSDHFTSLAPKINGKKKSKREAAPQS